MNAHLMCLELRIHVKTLMVNEVAQAILVDQCGVVSGCAFADLVIEAVVSDQLDAVIVIVLAALGSISSCSIDIRTGRIFGAEETHVISALSGQAAVSFIQIVIAGLRIILDIRSLAGLMIAACKMDAEVAVYEIAGDLIGGVDTRINGFTGRRIELEQEQSAGPGAVGHIQLFTGCIKEKIRVDRIWRIQMIPAAGLIEPVVTDLINAAVFASFFQKRRKIQIIIVPLCIAGAVAVDSSVFCKSGVNDGIHIGISAIKCLGDEIADAGTSPGRRGAAVQHVCAGAAIFPLIVRIPDRIRSPDRIAADAVPIVVAGPLERLLKRFLQVAVKWRIFRIAIVAVQLRPLNQIGRACGSSVRAEHIVHAVCFYDGRVMYAHAGRGFRCICCIFHIGKLGGSFDRDSLLLV